MSSGQKRRTRVHFAHMRVRGRRRKAWSLEMRRYDFACMWWVGVDRRGRRHVITDEQIVREGLRPPPGPPHPAASVGAGIALAAPEAIAAAAQFQRAMDDLREMTPRHADEIHADLLRLAHPDTRIAIVDSSHTPGGKLIAVTGGRTPEWAQDERDSDAAQ